MTIGFIEQGKEGVHSLRRQLVVRVRHKERGAQTENASDDVPDIEEIYHVEGVEGEAALQGRMGGGGSVHGRQQFALRQRSRAGGITRRASAPLNIVPECPSTSRAPCAEGVSLPIGTDALSAFQGALGTTDRQPYTHEHCHGKIDANAEILFRGFSHSELCYYLS